MSANNCTIELVHGGSVHVSHTLAEIQERRRSAHHSNTLVELERSTGAAAREARGFTTIALHPDHIVGVFPLISGSELPGKNPLEPQHVRGV